jgi:hypothetical protein
MQVRQAVYDRLHREVNICGDHVDMDDPQRLGIGIGFRSERLRRLVDDKTGTEEGLVLAFSNHSLLSAERVPFRAGALSSRSLRAAICQVRDAVVFVSIHGANLVNLLWLPVTAATHVIEVSMRFGWCCSDVPPANFLPPVFAEVNGLWTNMSAIGGGTVLPVGLPLKQEFPMCASTPRPDVQLLSSGVSIGKARGHCDPYHKADYVNLIRVFGMHHHEFRDVTFISGYINENPISREFIYVNSTALVVLASRLWRSSRR